MGTPQKDPFYIVKADIEGSVEKAQGQFSRWQGLASSSPDKARQEKDIQEECNSIAWQVDEMEKAVDVAEKSMARFGLTQQEISNRRKWVHQTRRQYEGLLTALEASHRVASRPAAGADPASKLGAAVRQDNDRLLDSAGDQQQLLLRQQDEQLDHLGQHVSRIGEVGLAIHDELRAQGGMLDELGEDIESTQSRIQAAQKKMAHVIEKAGLKGQIILIVFLLVLLVILLAILFA